ncbi:RUS family member 1 [Cylas formicarius]|uniref:RUS family member 1 n=1 Tax=Cylas formicarius TaxID=197179 RepID=UPI00295855B1|nr:RUS family member 1 [Cylas formicarius]
MVDLILTEQYGSTQDIISFTQHGNEIVEVKPQKNFFKCIFSFTTFFREILLPYGYPQSVSDDYLEYQTWDTLQALCSTITGSFTMRAVLRGVGVGDSKATALSAALTWIMKEGAGMIGRIVFAWWKGSELDHNCKKWRFFADILNDAAMLIELCLPQFQQYSTEVLCVTSVMKSIVGIAGGATRASITYHQAIKDNVADISAKDGSQETVVNLIGSFASIFLLNYFTDSTSEWLLILSLIILHLYTNYMAVKSLVFKNFNNQRIAIVLKTFLTVGTVPSPSKVNSNEAILHGFDQTVKRICGFEIILGESISKPLKLYTVAELKQILSVYEQEKYLLLVHSEKRKIYVSFEHGENARDVIAAYFHAVLLAIATSIYNSTSLDIYSKRQLHHTTPIAIIHTFMNAYEKYIDDYRNIPFNYLIPFNKLVKQEFNMFVTALTVNGWSMGSHSMKVGEHRIDFKTHKAKLT